MLMLTFITAMIVHNNDQQWNATLMLSIMNALNVHNHAVHCDATLRTLQIPDDCAHLQFPA